MSNHDLKKEKELLENAQTNKSMFDELYRYFVDDVYRFSYSIINNPHDAEDITSQVFLAFFNKLPSFEWQNISLKYWFFRTSRQLCYLKFRRKPELEYKDAIHSFDSVEISFVDEIMNRDLIEKIKIEIQKLAPIEQEIINLRIWEGLQFNEIAEVQESTLSACKLRFYRAIDKVKKSFEGKKGIGAIIALPVLFTAIREVGTLSAYTASPKLLAAGEAILMGKLAASTSGGILAALTTKAAIIGLISLTAITLISGGYLIQRANAEKDKKAVEATLENKDEKSGEVLPSISPTEIVTITPEVSSTPISTVIITTTKPTPTATVATTAAPITYRTYSGTDMVQGTSSTDPVTLTFQYPSNHTISKSTNCTGLAIAVVCTIITISGPQGWFKFYLVNLSGGSRMPDQSYSYTGAPVLVLKNGNRVVRSNTPSYPNNYSYQYLASCPSCADGSTLSANTMTYHDLGPMKSGFEVYSTSQTSDPALVKAFDTLMRSLVIQ
jgi:RNA polymerase sigma-70 factor (ECF subfamily)